MFFASRRLLLILLCGLWLPASWAADAVVLGVVPYLSARKLAQLYEPLRQQLALELSRPVLLESAADYHEFLARTARGEYDVIATSPYFGRLAQREQGYVPLARPLTDLEPLLVTRSDGPTSLAELKGKVVSTSDPLANLTLVAHRYLLQNGLVPGRSVEIRPMGSHANSVAALLNGESVAAIISVTALRQIHPETSARVRILKRLPPTTPLLYLAHQRLGADRIATLRTRLMQFANDTPAGKAFSSELGHDGLKPVSRADMLALDPYVRDLQGLLKP